MRLLTSIILLFLFVSLNGQVLTAQYGGGVVHQSSEPTTTPNYQLKPSLLVYDYNEQAIWGHSQSVGKYKLFSPKMVYVRGFVNFNFNNNQIISYSTIEQAIKIQQGVNELLNGLYMVKFTSNTGTLLEIAEIDMSNLPNLILTPPAYLVSDNDYFIITYERGILKKVLWINDKSNFYFQNVNTTIETISSGIKGKKDFLPKFKGENEIGLNVSRWFDTGEETGVQLHENSLITFQPQGEGAARLDIYNGTSLMGLVTTAMNGYSFTSRFGGLVFLTPSGADSKAILMQSNRLNQTTNIREKGDFIIDNENKFIARVKGIDKMSVEETRVFVPTNVETPYVITETARIKNTIIDSKGLVAKRKVLTTDDNYKAVWEFQTYTERLLHTKTNSPVLNGESETFLPITKKSNGHILSNINVNFVTPSTLDYVIEIMKNGVNIETLTITGGQLSANKDVSFILSENDILTAKATKNSNGSYAGGLLISFTFIKNN